MGACLSLGGHCPSGGSALLGPRGYAHCPWNMPALGLDGPGNCSAVPRTPVTVQGTAPTPTDYLSHRRLVLESQAGLSGEGAWVAWILCHHSPKGPQLLPSFRAEQGRTMFSGRILPVRGTSSPHGAHSGDRVGRVRDSQGDSVWGPSRSGSTLALVTSGQPT